MTCCVVLYRKYSGAMVVSLGACFREGCLSYGLIKSGECGGSIEKCQRSYAEAGKKSASDEKGKESEEPRKLERRGTKKGSESETNVERRGRKGGKGGVVMIAAER